MSTLWAIGTDHVPSVRRGSLTALEHFASVYSHAREKGIPAEGVGDLTLVARGGRWYMFCNAQ